MKKTMSLAAVSALALAAAAGAQEARDQMRIVGSSTVFPFSTSVAEQFASKTEFPAPIVESTGSGGGMKLFCGGVGVEHPDITNASRRMKASEWALCHENGVTDIVEVRIGFDGIVLANSKDAPELTLTRQEIFTALAAQTPTADDDCTMVDNPNVLWSDVNAALPATRIEVLGPPPTSGTRDAFVEIAMEGGAAAYSCLAALKSEDGDAFTAIAQTIREDGAWIDSGENDNAIVAALENTPTAVGVFGYSFLEENAHAIRGATVDGFEPTFDNIAEGLYPVSRSLYFYIKKQHVGVVPGIAEYAQEFASEEAWGDFGYLSEKGLIPLPEDDRLAMADHVANFVVMTGEEFSEGAEPVVEAADAGEVAEAAGDAMVEAASADIDAEAAVDAMATVEEAGDAMVSESAEAADPATLADEAADAAEDAMADVEAAGEAMMADEAADAVEAVDAAAEAAVAVEAAEDDAGED